MGLCLTYRTAHAVPCLIRSEMMSDARAVRRKHLWILCDPVSLAESEPTGQVLGFSHVHLFLPPEQLAEAHDSDRNCHDLEALLIQLIDWSRRYHLTWQLTLADEPFGSIRDGQYDPSLFDQFDALAELALNPGGDQSHPWADLPSPLPSRSLEFELPPSGDRPRLRIWPEPD